MTLHIASMMLLVTTVLAAPYKETADVIANYETLNKQMISVHGIISEVTRDSMSVTTI